MMPMTRKSAAAYALFLALWAAGGCARSVATPPDAGPAPATVPVAGRAGAAEGAAFGGRWKMEWCDGARPDLDCGGFSATLVQDGERLCGDYGSALINLRQVDEGRIVGTIVGNTAVLAVTSHRNGTIVLVRAQRRGNALHWREVDNIRSGGSDIAVIATDDVLVRDGVEPGARLDGCRGTDAAAED